MSKLSLFLPLSVLVLASLVAQANGGPCAYGICQTGCNAVGVACYAAAGSTFGTVTAGLGVPAVIMGCNVALGTCMAACVAAGFVPTP
jgi:hypothetical protein